MAVNQVYYKVVYELKSTPGQEAIQALGQRYISEDSVVTQYVKANDLDRAKRYVPSLKVEQYKAAGRQSLA